MSEAVHAELFRGRQFPDEVILVCVRWYLRYSLSLRDVRSMMAERSVSVDHTTIWRWVQRYAPELEKRLRGKLGLTGRSWRIDETYVRVGGEWTYLYRAIDAAGQTIDFYLSVHRDAEAARVFLRRALKDIRHPAPFEIVSDGHPAYVGVIEELRRDRALPSSCRHTTGPHRNDLLEQDHRGVKRRVVAKQWFRSEQGARNAIAGYEAVHMIRKGQVPWIGKRDWVGQAALMESLLREVEPAA